MKIISLTSKAVFFSIASFFFSSAFAQWQPNFRSECTTPHHQDGSCVTGAFLGTSAGISYKLSQWNKFDNSTISIYKFPGTLLVTHRVTARAGVVPVNVGIPKAVVYAKYQKQRTPGAIKISVAGQE